MHQAVIHIDPTGAAPVGFSQAAGMPGDVRFDFKTQGNLAYPGIEAMYPQMVLRPFTSHTVHPFDIVINDPVGASGIATVPGSVMNDRFSVEVYERNSIGQPQRMLAVGKIDLTGYAYLSGGPLSPASYPQGPAGPVGPAGTPGMPGATGEPGERGSRWYTGAGDPVAVPGDRVEGDMWLDETSGNVWRWDGMTMSWRGYVKA